MNLNTARGLAAALQEAKDEVAPTRRTAVVAAVNPDGTLDLTWPTGDVISSVPVLEGPRYATGQVVILLGVEGDYVVLGPIATTAPSPEVALRTFSIGVRGATNVTAPYGIFTAGGSLTVGQPFGANVPFLLVSTCRFQSTTNSGLAPYWEITQNGPSTGPISRAKPGTLDATDQTIDLGDAYRFDGSWSLTLGGALNSGASVSWFGATFTAYCIRTNS